MELHLFWILPAILFTLTFLYEPRRLFNSYLFTGICLMFVLINSGVIIVHIGHWINISFSLWIVAFFALSIPISFLFSTAYLLYNGHQMMRFEGRRLANLLSLFYGLALTFSILSRFLPQNAIFIKFLILSDFLLIYGTFLYVSYILYSLFYNVFPIRKKPDYIIILGSGLIDDKVPPLLAQRLEKGKAIYEKFHKNPKILVSGGQGSDEKIPEAQAMANYLRNTGIAAADILVENQSTTTLENLTFSRNILDKLGKQDYQTIVVTNSFHALRAGIYMRRIGIKGRSIGSKTAFYYLPSAYIRESIGLFVMYWKWHAIILSFYFIVWLINLFH